MTQMTNYVLFITEMTGDLMKLMIMAIWMSKEAPLYNEKANLGIVNKFEETISN